MKFEEKSTALKTLKSLLVLGNLNKVNMDLDQISHQFGLEGEVSEKDLLLICKKYGLKAKIHQYKTTRLEKIPLPAMVQMKEGYFMVLAQIREDKILYMDPDEQIPKLMLMEEFRNEYTGITLLAVDRKFISKEVTFGLKWFIPSIVKFKKAFIEVLVGALALQLLGLGAPLVTQVIVDKVLMHKSFSTLNVLMIGLMIIAFFEMILGMAKNYVFTHTTNRIDVILSSRLFDHLFRLPLRYFESRRVGDTIARVREVENIRRFLTGAPLSSVLDIMFIVVYLAVMWLYSSALTKIVLFVLPLFVLLSLIVTPLFKARLEDKFTYGAESQSFLVEAVSGVQTIKSFALEPLSQKRWEDKISEYTTASFKTSILGGNANAIGQFIQRSMDLAILWTGAHLVMANAISIGQLIAFRMLSSHVSGPILRIVQMWQDFQQTSVSLERLGDIFNTKPEPSTDGQKIKLPAIIGEISFQNVCFRYRLDGSEIIRDLSVDIKAGTTVGIVGRSGSGKSTLSKLVQRLYIPERGKILIDGVDIAMADPSWLRRQIGVVLQENFLFSGTVKDNICIHHPTASMESIIEAAKIAGAHEFILELQEGYDAQVGEKGTSLSGGQRQRIAIARALLTNPRILIFDEATSALDYESERIIQKNLTRICKGRTVLIIAHRLSTIQGADGIMVMDKGKIIEMGNHKNLMRKQGLYHYLFSQQSIEEKEVPLCEKKGSTIA
ncbi:type I secretion system permease/ATPase [Fusibacter sp. 3D3]|uniref:type I secretion system permease/ATPase n=1 Tax=Fusibacter sp. 3D3 TaxID=1048380 RepID=UPI000852C8FE|nr:type I secretion system permease/ATPase [Fusibacter sp. 3D3]GAU75504.1 cyclolysin secretion ATP-binding protein [Fusibacter sp. 3D3]